MKEPVDVFFFSFFFGGGGRGSVIGNSVHNV